MATTVKAEDIEKRPVAGTTVPKADDRARERRLWIIGLCIMVALVVACYAFAMNAYWAGDDFNYVRPKDWSAVLNFLNPVGRAQYRPLQDWSQSDLPEVRKREDGGLSELAGAGQGREVTW